MIVGGSKGIYMTVWNGSGAAIPRSRGVRLDSTTVAAQVRSNAAGDPSDIEVMTAVQVCSAETEILLGVTMQPIPNLAAGQICILGICKVEVEAAITPGQPLHLGGTAGQFDDAAGSVAIYGNFVANEVTLDSSVYEDFVLTGGGSDPIYAWAWLSIYATPALAVIV